MYVHSMKLPDRHNFCYLWVLTSLIAMWVQIFSGIVMECGRRGSITTAVRINKVLVRVSVADNAIHRLVEQQFSHATLGLHHEYDHNKPCKVSTNCIVITEIRAKMKGGKLLAKIFFCFVKD